MYPGAYAAQAPDKIAATLVDTGQTLSYGELEERSVRLAHVLHDAGLRPGDVVALLTENNLRAFEVYWAAMRSGLYITRRQPQPGPGRGLLHRQRLGSHRPGRLIGQGGAGRRRPCRHRRRDAQAGLRRPGGGLRLLRGRGRGRVGGPVRRPAPRRPDAVFLGHHRPAEGGEDARHRYDVSSLKVAIHAAAPCPVEVKQKMIEWWGPVLAEYYAGTEANGMTVIDSATWATRPGTVGRPALGVLRICDDESGAELPAGEIGLVYFERDVLPFSYHNDPEKTAAAQHPEHPTWTALGDIGHVDEDGFLFLTDRKAFMIISGGVNIYPQETENVLALHPAIHDVAVIGLPDPEMGERVVAFVQTAAGVETGPELEQEIIAFVR